MHADNAVQRIAASQGGVVTRRQAINSGLSPNQIDGRVRTGRWRVVTSGGYRLFDMPGEFDLVKSATALLPRAFASHFSAARIHGMTMLKGEPTSVIVHTRTTHTFPGVLVHRCHDLQPDHVTSVLGIPVTTIARTVVDVASSISPKHLEIVVDDNIAAQRVTHREIREVLDAVARKGKPGVRKLRSILDGREGVAIAPSTLEARGNKLLREAGIVTFLTEYAIPWDPLRRFDVAIPENRLAVEWDSRRWHMQAQAFASDRRRDREVVTNGWRILRFTWDDVHRQPQLVIDTVLAALAA